MSIRGIIKQLTPAQREACEELAEHIRSVMQMAGEPVGRLALALAADAALDEQLPDLLTALRFIDHVCPETPSSDGDYRKVIQEVGRIARAAIAKATA